VPQVAKVAHCQAIKIKDEGGVLSSFLSSVPVVKCGNAGDKHATDFVLSGRSKDPRSTSDASRATVSLAQCHDVGPYARQGVPDFHAASIRDYGHAHLSNAKAGMTAPCNIRSLFPINVPFERARDPSGLRQAQRLGSSCQVMSRATRRDIA